MFFNVGCLLFGVCTLCPSFVVMLLVVLCFPCFFARGLGFVASCCVCCVVVCGLFVVGSCWLLAVCCFGVWCLACWCVVLWFVVWHCVGVRWLLAVC